MHIILMGPQGAGKGTQADAVGPRLGLVKLSTGDTFRAAIASGGDLGKVLKEILDRGDLVPDELTLSIVEERIDQIMNQPGVNGVLFDGFPRTSAQAAGLTDILERRGERLASVIEIVVPREILVERLSGRWVCPVCGTTYHSIFNPPKVAGICDREGATLVQRDDDKPEAIERRLSLYDTQTAPLLDYYRQRGLLSQVNGEQSIDAVTADIIATVERATAGQQAAVTDGSHD
jgi:adenylate kinase